MLPQRLWQLPAGIERVLQGDADGGRWRHGRGREGGSQREHILEVRPLVGVESAGTLASARSPGNP